MLIDIFARRYENLALRDNFEQRDSRLLSQAFRILSEDIHPYYSGGEKNPASVAFWTALHDGISRELGLKELSPIWAAHTARRNGNDRPQTFQNTMVNVCEKWLSAPVSGSADTHIKERLSLIELGFRQQETELTAWNQAEISDLERLTASLKRPAMRIPGTLEDGVRAWREKRTAAFKSNVEELNTRFRQASYPLHYHNGFIQITTDALIQTEVEAPFWSLISDPIWKNVDHDMKEALDLRDSDARDPAFYAARALESTIKIISDRKGWTQGREKGAHNYIDNLAAKNNGLIVAWESSSLKDYFAHVRNPFGHGPGNEEMPNLSRQQTEWAIEFCMIWIKCLILRM